MSVNSVTFVATNLAWGEARGGSIPRQWGCDRRATKPQAKFGATLRAAVLFGPGGVARSIQIRVGYALVPVRKHLAPCRGRKLLAANVTELTLLTTKARRDPGAWCSGMISSHSWDGQIPQVDLDVNRSGA